MNNFRLDSTFFNLDLELVLQPANVKPYFRLVSNQEAEYFLKMYTCSMFIACADGISWQVSAL